MINGCNLQLEEQDFLLLLVLVLLLGLVMLIELLELDNNSLELLELMVECKQSVARKISHILAILSKNSFVFEMNKRLVVIFHESHNTQYTSILYTINKRLLTLKTTFIIINIKNSFSVSHLNSLIR